ncbi:urokinase plasminogen activator surface receptor-like [Sphaeramia orbicularis]|uniref:urokinase plasminogen activator surface receptor-like n=1 Tax=Sphaeramia orbicularis TaxID=375764 RepID=UPI00117C6501|nr:urokinase plasminogen activator surface receptor-like [Sphaeramia orbicularis]
MRGVRSYNLGFDSESQTYICCDTDRCNYEDQPFPDVTPNGLQCYTCPDPQSPRCTQMVDCVGVQDRCIGGTEPNGLKSYGCVSTNMCDPVPPGVDPGQTSSTGPTCCESSLCNRAGPRPDSGHKDSASSGENSAPSVVLGVFCVLIPLTALII